MGHIAHLNIHPPTQPPYMLAINKVKQSLVDMHTLVKRKQNQIVITGMTILKNKNGSKSLLAKILIPFQ